MRCVDIPEARVMVDEGANDSAAEACEGKQQAELERLEEEVKMLRGLLDEQTAMTMEHLELAKRIQADFDNFKKRVQREKEEVVRCANDRLVLDLLGTLDDLERALSANSNPDEIHSGVRQIQSNLSALLQSYGLREMPLTGRFDPNLHEALCVGDGEEGTILETFQKGYYLGPRVLRHAKVMVGKCGEEVKIDG
jgi:molecular chaperone GrpE